MKKALFFLLLPLLLLSCSDQQEQKLSRYYGVNSNFVVNADSMALLRYQPSETALLQDTLYVYDGETVAIADILTSDSLDISSDTTWIQLVRDENTFGWIEEMEMRQQVVPADPISQFIALFSESHRMVSLIVIAIIVVAFFVRRMLRQGIYLVHFNDIPTGYPTALTILMSLAASLYATIQMVAPEQWQNYYYNPTLNPLAEDGLIAWFLALVWVVIIMAVACISEVHRFLHTGDALLYLCGLYAICAADYIIFSQLTLIKIGYPLLAAYVVWGGVKYFRRNRHYRQPRYFENSRRFSNRFESF